MRHYIVWQFHVTFVWNQSVTKYAKNKPWVVTEPFTSLPLLQDHIFKERHVVGIFIFMQTLLERKASRKTKSKRRYFSFQVFLECKPETCYQKSKTKDLNIVPLQSPSLTSHKSSSLGFSSPSLGSVTICHLASHFYWYQSLPYKPIPILPSWEFPSLPRTYLERPSEGK